jgi:rhodanese-related sulfurtransferase
VKPLNFLRILLASVALAAYSSWSLAVREKDKDGALPVSSSEVAGIPLLNLAEAKTLWSEAGTLFVDVRSPVDYAYGHIEGAISIPYEEFEELLSKNKPQLRQARAIVVYCKSKDCGKSLWAAIRLHQQGLTQTRIYPNGWNEWDTNRLPRTHGGR